MSLLANFASRGPRGTARSISVGPPVDVVPSPPHVLTPRLEEFEGADVGRAEVAERLSRALLAIPRSEVDLGWLEAGVDELVDVWTPSLHVHSRFELMSVVTEGDDAIGAMKIDLAGTVVAGRMTTVEWTATGRFTGPTFFDDDQLIEPTGAVVRVGGVLCFVFDDGQRASRISCYYDRLGLIEQLLHRPTAPG